MVDEFVPRRDKLLLGERRVPDLFYLFRFLLGRCGFDFAVVFGERACVKLVVALPDRLHDRTGGLSRLTFLPFRFLVLDRCRDRCGLDARSRTALDHFFQTVDFLLEVEYRFDDRTHFVLAHTAGRRGFGRQSRQDLLRLLRHVQHQGGGVDLYTVRRGGHGTRLHHGESLGEVLELADVAGPAVVPQDRDGFVGEAYLAEAALLGEVRRELAEEEVDVVFALAKGRDLDLEGVETIVEVFAELARLHGVEEVHVGGGNHADVGLLHLGGTDLEILTVLKHTQEHCLGLARELSDLVEEERAAVGFFEITLAGCDCAGE